MAAKTKAEKIIIAQRRAEATKLRATGATLESVAAVISQKFNLPNYDRSNAFKDVDSSLKVLNEECSHNTEEYRRRELELLDQCQYALMKKVKAGDTKAIDSTIRISDRRARLLGLDAPVQLMIEQRLDMEMQQLIQGLQPLLRQDTYVEVLQAITMIGDRAAVAASN